MLDATIYIKAINTAARTGDTGTLLALIDYCAKFGLNLDTLDRQGRAGLTLQRNGCEPYALDILIDGKDGWRYRETSNRRSWRYLNEECDDLCRYYWDRKHLRSDPYNDDPSGPDADGKYRTPMAYLLACEE